MKNIVFINSHPIQYFAPLYQKIAEEEQEELSLKVLYLTDETVNGYKDKQFGETVKWDIKLLEGYNYKFIPNNSWKPSLYNGFWGLLNWGLIKEISEMPRSVIISHGWAYASNILAIWVAKLYGHTVCIRGDNPYSHEKYKPKVKRALRWLFLKIFVFSVVDRYLYVGEENRRLYKSFNIPDKKLIFVPHAIDNKRFRDFFEKGKKDRNFLRRKLGLENKKIILFSGKLIEKKRPLDLLFAYKELAEENKNLALIYIGDGKLKGEIKSIALENKIPNVIITGFINQTEIPRYYNIGDVFVMCSGFGETWGLSVNEAMNFNLPIIVSNLTGCSSDLVEINRNGFIFPVGKLKILRGFLKKAIEGDLDGKESGILIKKYSFDNMILNLKKIPDRI